MQKLLIVLGIIAATVAALFLLNRNETPVPAPSPTDKLTIATSFYPTAHFAEIIGGEYVDVIQIVPDGVEVHEYEPSAKDLEKVFSADLIIAYGAGIDPWAEKIAYDPSTKTRTVVLQDISSYSFNSGDEEGIDPHAWLAPARAVYFVAGIGKAMEMADPAHADIYERNMLAYQQELLDLDRDFTDGLRVCALHDVVVAHDAFSYWETEYNIVMHPVLGIVPDEEPSAQDIARMIEEAREAGVGTVYSEANGSSAIAETIASEIGAKTDVLNPLETLSAEERAAGETYLSIMRKNLEALRRGLACE